WGVSCLLLPPLAWAALRVVGEWRRDPHRGTVSVHLVMTAVGVACIGGAVLGLAGVVAGATERWSAAAGGRAVRARGFGGGAGGVGGGGGAVVLLGPAGPGGGAGRGGGGAKKPQAGPADPGVVPDRGGWKAFRD